jgi:hypothetical protein
MSAANDKNLDLAGLTAIINSRLASEARVAQAIGFGWLCGGVAIACCLSAAGFAIALYGYSYTISVEPAAEQTARALVKALERAELNTTVSGTMSIAPNTQLTLAPGQTVKLLEGTTVKLDPNSTVRVVGDVKFPQPSNRQLQPKLMNGDQLPFTTYTIFRSVKYGSGYVQTGWSFDLSDTTRPKYQACSYIQSITNSAQVKDLIAINGTPQRPPPSAKLTFDFNGAVANCTWFSGV